MFPACNYDYSMPKDPSDSRDCDYDVIYKRKSTARTWIKLVIFILFIYQSVL